MRRSWLPWCHPAGLQGFISILFLPQFLSCGQQQQQERKKKNVCVLMAAGSLNTMSGKNKEKMVRDRESSQDEVKSLWNIFNRTWTFYDIHSLMNTHSSPKAFFVCFGFVFWVFCLFVFCILRKNVSFFIKAISHNDF